MEFIDTHTHLYLDNYKDDREAVIERAFENGVSKILLPNIDNESYTDMISLCEQYPENIFPMIGLHPGSVEENYKDVLRDYYKKLKSGKFVAVGEIGVDLYWEKKYKNQQMDAFKTQVQWSLEFDLPVSIHTRDSFDEVKEVIEEIDSNNFKGIFHCFTGTKEQAEWILSKGFLLGIGGIVTFKNSELDKTLAELSVNNLVLETDAPFLTPSPYRGKRNESSYLKYIAEKIAEIYNLKTEEVAEITSNNARNLFLK